MIRLDSGQSDIVVVLLWRRQEVVSSDFVWICAQTQTRWGNNEGPSGPDYPETTTCDASWAQPAADAQIAPLAAGLLFCRSRSDLIKLGLLFCRSQSDLVKLGCEKQLEAESLLLQTWQTSPEYESKSCNVKTVIFSLSWNIFQNKGTRVTKWRHTQVSYLSFILMIILRGYHYY